MNWRFCILVNEIALMMYWIFDLLVLIFDHFRESHTTGIALIDAQMSLTAFAPMVIVTLITLLSRRRYY